MQIDPTKMAHTFIDRTMANLHLIKDQNRPKEEIFEVTQMINSFTGILVYPIAKMKNYKDRLQFDEIIGPLIEIKTNNNNQAPLVNKLRNAIAHGNYKFRPDRHNPLEIGSIMFWDKCSSGQKCFEASITVTNLYKLIEAISGRLKDFEFRVI